MALNPKTRRVVRLAGLVTWIVATTATAQSVNTSSALSDAQRKDSAGTVNELAEVIVTARRKEENLQTIPLSVTAFSAMDIARQNIIGPEDFNRSVPSLTVTQQSTERDSAEFTIRGQGETQAGGEPAVVTYFAEVPTIALGPGFLFDLASLEVLKGPQGTLFGRNTTGGAILMEPQRPTDQFGGYVDETLGDYGLDRTQAAINLPFNDFVQARVAFDINHRSGFTRDAITGREYDNRDYQAYRIGLLITPNDRIGNYFSMNYATSNTNDAGTAILSVDPTGLTASLYPTLPQALALQQSLGPRVVEHDVQNGYDIYRNTAVTNSTTVDLTDNLHLKNIMGYRDFRERNGADLDGTLLPILGIPANPYWTSGLSAEPSSDTYTEELQLQGSAFDKRMSWTTGYYGEYRKPATASDQDWLSEFASSEATIPASIVVDQSLKRDRSQALYGQFTYGLTDNLKFTAGGRYTEDWRAQVASEYLQAFPCGATPFGYCNLSQSAKFHAPTGNLSLEYQIDPSTMLYVTGRRGYKSGGFNITAPTAAERVFAPEYVTDIELGAKTEFEVIGMKGRVNTALYRSMFKDLQETGTVIADGEAVDITANAGKGVIEGAEVEAAIFPTRHIELSGFYGYADAYYISNVFGGVDLSHIPFANLPKNKLSLTARYLFDLPSNIGSGSLSATTTYQSTMHFLVPLIADDTDPYQAQSGYSLLNLRAAWTDVYGMPLELSAFVTNATNKVYLAMEANEYNAIGYSSGIYGEPRMWGVEARYRFGKQ
jgi:iron complex outermembrane recepter protein